MQTCISTFAVTYNPTQTCKLTFVDKNKHTQTCVCTFAITYNQMQTCKCTFTMYKYAYTVFVLVFFVALCAFARVQRGCFYPKRAYTRLHLIYFLSKSAFARLHLMLFFAKSAFADVPMVICTCNMTIGTSANSVCF